MLFNFFQQQTKNKSNYNIIINFFLSTLYNVKWA